MKTILYTVFSLVFPLSLLANTVTAVTSANSPGDWDKAATWSGGRVPQSGDLVLIPFAKGVTIKGVEYSTPPTLIIQVWGTIHFEPSGRLDLSATSSLQLFLGGKIMPRNSSSSQTITLGGVIKYNAANNGTVNGPAIANVLSGVSTSGQPMSGFSNGTPLAVLFKSFSGEETNNGFVLRWETSEEVNVDHFEIEKSYNGGGWVPIGTIPTKGAAGSYTFTSFSTISGKLFFRIKTIYTSNDYHYSSILTLEKNNIVGFLLSPNPASDFVTVFLSKKPTGKIIVGIVSLAGIEVTRIENIGTRISLRLSLASLPAGTYLLFVENEAKARVTKMLIVQ